jgi:hypothetical protein
MMLEYIFAISLGIYYVEGIGDDGKVCSLY